MRRAILSSVLASAVLAAAPSSAQTPTPPRSQRLESPTRLALDGAGRVLVTDALQHGVFVIDTATRRAVDFLAVDGRPVGIACLGKRTYVGNATSQRIEIFGPKGKRLGTLGGAGTVVGEARDLAVDAGRQLLFAVDGVAEEVKVFDLAVKPEGQLLWAIGAPGTLSSEFQNPTGIAVDPAAEEVYVADYGDSVGLDPRVLVFGYDGTFHEYVTSDGGTEAWFFRPQGLALGPTGHIFVTDAWYGKVVVMDRVAKTRLDAFGDYGSGAGELKLPLDVVFVGPDLDAWVVDNRNRRLQVFPQGGKL